MSLDGTSLPTVRTSYGWSSRSIDDLRTSTASLLAEKQSFGMKRHFVCDAHDFSAPSAWMVGAADEMAKSYPKIIMSGPEEFVETLLADDAPLRLTSRNATQYHIGTQNSRSEMKIANRMCENALTEAERWCTFASLMGAVYPDIPLDMAWRQVIFGQHHDALTGTPCDASYLDTMAGYREALELGHGCLRAATQFIADGVETPDVGEPVVVFNPMNWDRGGVLIIDKPADADNVEAHTLNGDVLKSEMIGDNVEVLVDAVPSVGYTTLTLHDSSDKCTDLEPVGGTVLQNEYWTITLDPERGGGILSLVDRETGRELIDQSKGVGNDLGALRELNSRSEASWELWTLGERVWASDSRADVEVESSPTKQVATIKGQLGSLCTYVRTLSVRPGQRRIEANVMLDGYIQEDNLFVVATPLALRGSLPIFEDRFGTLVARRGKTAFDYRTKGPVRESGCVVYPVYNWAEAGWSARVDIGDETSLNVGLAGLITPHDDEIEQRLGPLMKSLAGVGVTCTPYHDDDDDVRISGLDGTHGPFGATAAYDNTLKPRLEDIELSAEWVTISVAGNNTYTEELLNRLPGAVRDRIEVDEAHQGWSVVVAEDSTLPDDWPAMPVIVISATSYDGLSDVLAKIDGDLARDARIVLPDGCDFRENPGPVDSYGFAYLTSGTGSVSMEPDGTLTMFLTHTSNWSASHLKAGRFVPEHRTMVFQYGLYPHDGSWRDGDVIRAGYDFLNPLSSVVPFGDGAALPPSRSFVTLDTADAVITAIKPVGNHTARFENTASDPRNGVVVRAYNASGRESSGRLSLGDSLSAAYNATMMEEDIERIDIADGSLEWGFDPFAIETVRLVPDTSDWSSLGNVELGPRTAATQPIWCRHWKHNVGAHPTGYLPVGIYIDGELPIEKQGGSHPTVGRLRVWIVNNCTDKSITGSAKIVAPHRWSALPSDIPYDIPPRGHLVREITMAFNTNERTGLIKARMEHAGQTYQDVLEVGRSTNVELNDRDSTWRNTTDIVKEREPEWRVVLDGDEIVAHVSNPWWESLDVELVLLTPLETWGELAGAHGLCNIEPAHAGMTIVPRAETTMRFAISNANGTKFWAWVKLTCNGKADYKRVC